MPENFDMCPGFCFMKCRNAEKNDFHKNTKRIPFFVIHQKLRHIFKFSDTIPSIWTLFIHGLNFVSVV